MNSLYQELEIRKQRLEKAIQSAEQFLKNAPEGRLRINNRHNGSSFYHVTQYKDTCGVYIPVGNAGFVSQLAQKDYAKRFLKQAYRELADINACIQGLRLHDSESVFSGLGKQRQNMISPYLADNDFCAEKWNSLPFQASTYKPEEKIFKTKRGEMVRSKSELLQADTYFDLGIPYRYECLLTLRDGTTKAPDFTLFHAPRRTTIYQEHFGRMDDEEYVNRNMKKLREYEENGIFVGKNLILTFETKNHPFNVHAFREQIKQIFWLK